MKKGLLVLLFQILFFYVSGQQNGVEIIEEVGRKRTLIYAKNTTNEHRSVFFKVNAIGYRRSGDRPVIKQLAPNAKALLITLIPLVDHLGSTLESFSANGLNGEWIDWVIGLTLLAQWLPGVWTLPQKLIL